MKYLKKLFNETTNWFSDWIRSLILEYATRKLLKTLPPQKYLIMGYARHGKDTVAEMLQSYYGIRFKGATQLAAEHIVYPTLRHKYKNVKECYNDRGNHRKMWFSLIQKYNKTNKTAFIEFVLRHSDIYCGLRCQQEFLAAAEKKIFDFTLWVDALNRKPPENTNSCTVKSFYADVVLDNNTTKMALRKNLAYAMYNHAYFK